MFEFNPLLTLSSTEFQVEEHGHPPSLLVNNEKPLNSIDRGARRGGRNLYLLIKLVTKFPHTYVTQSPPFAPLTWNKEGGAPRVRSEIMSEALKSLCKTGLACSSLTRAENAIK